MVSHLDSLISNNHTVSVYFIEDVITNTSTKSIISANITTDKDKLNDKLKKVQFAFKQPHIRSTLKVYQYKDKFMHIENSNNYTFFKETEISSCLNLNNSLDDSQTIVRITDTTSISKEQFPVISNYSNVCTQRIRTVVYGPDDAIKIHFIEETSEGKSANGEPVYYVLVQFVNSNKEILDSCKNVIKLLS